MRKRNELLLVLTAFIWGVAFVAQSAGGSQIGSFSFLCIRSFIGFLVLLPTIKLLDRLGLSKNRREKADKINLVKGGICCGCILFTASILQQLGIDYGTPAGKAGFLTACYIVIVPVLGIFIKKKCGINVWIGVVLTLIGLYLLCMEGDLSIQKSDLLVILCAVTFSFHILVVDHFSPLVDGVRMSCIQFLVAGILSVVPMIIFDMKPFESGLAVWTGALMTLDAWIPILYAGVCSSGIAYTLQIVGQQNVDPTVASLLMSLESVFSVIAGFVILHERMSLKALLGCGFIFIAVVLSQLPSKAFFRKTELKS